MFFEVVVEVEVAVAGDEGDGEAGTFEAVEGVDDATVVGAVGVGVAGPEIEEVTEDEEGACAPGKGVEEGDEAIEGGAVGSVRVDVDIGDKDDGEVSHGEGPP